MKNNKINNDYIAKYNLYPIQHLDAFPLKPLRGLGNQKIKLSNRKLFLRPAPTLSITLQHTIEEPILKVRSSNLAGLTYNYRFDNSTLRTMIILRQIFLSLSEHKQGL